MGYKKNFRKKKLKDTAVGLSVTVYNDNIDMALKKLKRKVKNDGLLLQ